MKQEYCIYCMNPSPAEVCPHCGKRRSEYVTDPHHLTPGTLLNGKYEVGAVLGEGGFGITYIGRDRNLELRIAIKEYFPSGIVNRNNTASAEITASVGKAQEVFEKGKASFLEEARTLAKFSNLPNIVSVRDFFAENNTAYIVMEYLEGTNLKDYLTQKSLMSFEQAFELLSPVMSALAKVHERGLIHRDISPANIMVLEDGTVKLLDFGAARDVSGADEKSLSVMLKPGYAPEEQYRSKGNQGPWTDVYALSATLYKIVTGITPDDAMNRIYRDELAKPSSVNGNITEEQEKVILKGMAVYQENRFQSVTELQLACQDSISHRPDAEELDSDDEVTISEEQYLAQQKNRRDSVPDDRRREKEAEDRDAASHADVRERRPEPEKRSEPEKRVKTSAGKNRPADASGGKAPNKLCFLLSTAVGAAFFVFLMTFVASVAMEAEAVLLAGQGGLCAVSLIAAAGLGYFYYPRLHNRERRPNRLCLAGSILMSVVAVVWTWVVYRMYVTGSYRDGTLEGSLVLSLFSVALAVFFGYFYYPRLERKKREKAVWIHGGVLGSGLAVFVIYVVVFSLNHVTIGDTHVSRGETRLSLFGDIINNRDIAKLKSLKKLERLSIYGCFMDNEDVEAIGELTWLKELSLENNEDITDVSPLNHLKNLTSLNLSSTGMTDISCLKDLTLLEDLRINDTKVSDLSVLSSYGSLKFLYMSKLSELDEKTISLPASVQYLYCSEDGLTTLDFLAGVDDLLAISADGNDLADIAPLGRFGNLGTVDVSNNHIEDISPACGTRLSELAFNNNQVSDLSALQGIRLYRLEGAGNQITDISALADNSQLQYVDLNHNQITDISPLKDCFKIYSLDLSYNAIEDLSALTTIDELETVNLRSNKIKDISPLAQTKKLVNKKNTLDLRDNEIENVEALAKFTNVSDMHLENNHIKDVSPLASCVSLVYLRLNHNQVSDISPLAALPLLNTLELVDNPVTNLSSIALNPSPVSYVSRSVLRISYNDSIDWQKLGTIEKLGVVIYDATDRQKANLKEFGFSSFATSDSLDAQD